MAAPVTLFPSLQGAAGEAVVMDDDEDEPVDGPEPEALALPDALPIALVDESLPVSTSLKACMLQPAMLSMSCIPARSQLYLCITCTNLPMTCNRAEVA